MELLTQAAVDNPVLFPPLGETLFLVNFNELTVESIECEEYSPILFRRKDSRNFEATKSHSQQIVRSLEEGEKRLTEYLTERVRESWDEYAQWNQKLNDLVQALTEKTNART